MATTQNAREWLKQWQIKMGKGEKAPTLTPLAGLTGGSQLVTLENGERYVLRTQLDRTTDCGVDYQQESLILQSIQPLGFTPLPIAHSSPFSLLSWIEGEIPAKWTMPILLQLADHLARLHTFLPQEVDFPQRIATLDIAERCQWLWDKLPPEKHAQLTFKPPFLSISPFSQALCHHDVHLQNVVVQNGKLFLIDWEYSAWSDPALEIAMLFYANPLTAIQQHTFLSHYVTRTGVNSPAFLAKMAEYTPMVEKLNRLWFLI